ncbi:hypothetical protein OG422_25405 [Streptomyces sp. NBC_01525]|uniref:hypothetical protein n=1 Tax=Streptomyces sp. NBC_01525 TaxID=2903893 RepID=UPI00386ED229
MTGSDRAEELQLARVSAAGSRARLGRRRATYRAAPPGHAPRTAPRRSLRQALATRIRRLWSPGAPAEEAAPRLDFYDHGMTVATNGRIHAIRYDTTVVRRRGALSPQGLAPVHVLRDIDGDHVLLHAADFGDPEVWGREIRRAVTGAQVPRALATLAGGGRLTFGPVWLTADGIGRGTTSLRWDRIQRVASVNGAVAVRVAGRWHVLASGLPSPFVLHALAAHLATTADDG